MSKKFIIGIIIFIVLALSIGVGVYLVQQNQKLEEQASPASTLKLTPGAKSSFVGESVTVTVDIDTTTNTATGANIDIKFSPDKLTLQSFEPGTSLPVVLSPAKIDNATGTASISLSAQPANPFQGKGIVATLKFATKEAGAATISFGSNTSAKGAKEAGADILVNKIPTNLTILSQDDSGVTASTQPSSSPIASSLPKTSSSPKPSTTPTPLGGAGSISASATPSATATASATPVSSVKPTVTLPVSGKLKAGDIVSGTAKASSIVTITVKSEVVTDTVKADANGKWSYKIPTNITAGSHTITVTDPNGTVTKSFTVTSSGATSSADSDVPETGNELPTIVAAFTGIVLLFVGIAIAL